MRLVFQSVLFVLVMSQSVAEFVFEIQVFSITTSRNTDCGGPRGDDSTPECETYLSIFCLREDNRNTTSEDCSLGTANGTRVHYYESLPLLRYIISDLPWPETVQLYINAKDRDDGDKDDNIDDIFIDITMAADYIQPEITEHYTGVRGNVTVQLSVRVYCMEDYYGDDCFTYCIPQDDDENGHFACDAENGTPICLNGFQNPDNNCVDKVIVAASVQENTSRVYEILAGFLGVSVLLNIIVIVIVAVLFKKVYQKNAQLEDLSKENDHGIEMKTNEVYGLTTSFEHYQPGNSTSEVIVNEQDARNETLDRNYDYIRNHRYNFT